MNTIINSENKFSFVYYQDEFFYYFRKPAWISSSRWKTASFLDLMLDVKNNESIKNIVQSQYAFFWKEKELWLLNRLDMATTWLLYFAKNFKVYSKFRELQKENMVDKYYVAEVYGNLNDWVNVYGKVISYNIMHHRYCEDRMVVIKEENDVKNGSWKQHNVSTEICEAEFLEEENRSVVLIKIHKGIRHQIRAHLSSIGYPICGDLLYCKSKKQYFEKMQLFSVWMVL